VVSTRGKLSGVGEVQILRDQKSLLTLSCTPHLRVDAATEALVKDRIDVVSKKREPFARRGWDIFVELEFQATLTSGGIGDGAGKSSLAAAAANAITARMSSSLKLGNSARISTLVDPCAR